MIQFRSGPMSATISRLNGFWRGIGGKKGALSEPLVEHHFLRKSLGWHSMFIQLFFFSFLLLIHGIIYIGQVFNLSDWIQLEINAKRYDWKTISLWDWKKYFCFRFPGRFTNFNIKETPYNILQYTMYPIENPINYHPQTQIQPTEPESGVDFKSTPD